MKSILIIGLGRFGRHMASKFIEDGNSVLAIEQSETRADQAVSFINDIQIADATDEEYIKSLGVNNFDICVIAIGDNFQSALEITVLLKDHGARFIVARATREVHRKLLLRNGADHVVYAEKETAERLAMKYGSKHLFDYIELSDEVAICEIAVPDGWVGKTIVQKAVRNKYGISILATKQGEEIFPLPNPDHVFQKNETLLVLASEDHLQELVK